MNTQTYYVYNPTELFEKLDSNTNQNNEVDTFFKNFSFEDVASQQTAKGNTTQVFNKIIKEDTTKAKIIGYLNKLNQHNLSKVVSSIRDIVFQTNDELNELVYQCIQKIKRDNDLIRPLVAALCKEFLSLYFVTSDNDKIYFRKLLLTEVKKEYVSSIDFDSSEWSKEKSDRVMILISTLYNEKIIEDKIMSSIINDLKKNITYKPNETQEYYEHVEKSVQLLSCLVSSIALNPESKIIFNGLDLFLEEQMKIYEEVKCIQKKTRLICKNIAFELTKH
jgi:hypothetical protein